MTYVIIWLALAVVFAIAEATTTQLVSIWFLIGSLAALAIAAAGGDFWLQMLAFGVVAAFLLVITRPLVKKYLTNRIVPTNADRAIGQTAIALTDIGEGAVGQAKVNGLVWSAVSATDELIKEGERVNVKAIEGVKLIVERDSTNIKEGAV